jgi:site-specific DNA recombinase
MTASAVNPFAEAIIDRATFEQVQQVLDAHRASGDRSHKHSHHLIGSLHCGTCQRRLGFNRIRGNGGVYDYFACLSRVSRHGRCSAPHFRANAIERAVKRKYKTFLLTSSEQAAIREALLARAHASTAQARKDAERHERRARELINHQHKLLDLYYGDGVSKEVLQAQQKRLEAEQAKAQRLASTARFEVSELDQALNDALLLIDKRLVPYLTGSPSEKRLINLAIYVMLLVSETGGIDPQPAKVYAEIVPLTRSLARKADQASTSRSQDGRGPAFRGHGLKPKLMAERGGFEPPNEVSPVTRFPVAPVQPLRHLSRAHTVLDLEAYLDPGSVSGRSSSPDRASSTNAPAVFPDVPRALAPRAHAERHPRQPR